MPEARRIPLNWNALLRLSDLGGFLRKWAFKCALRPFTSADDVIEYYDSRCVRDRPKSHQVTTLVSRKFDHKVLTFVILYQEVLLLISQLI